MRDLFKFERYINVKKKGHCRALKSFMTTWSFIFAYSMKMSDFYIFLYILLLYFASYYTKCHRYPIYYKNNKLG